MTRNSTGVDAYGGLHHQALSETESENTSGIMCFQSNKTWRIVLGICVLLAVDLIWVGSAELTDVSFRYFGILSRHPSTFYITSKLQMVYILKNII